MSGRQSIDMKALFDRIERLRLSDLGYDLSGLMDEIARDGEPADDSAFLRLLMRHEMDIRTSLPCPIWCRLDRGHPFAGEFEDGRQYRHHSRQLDAPDRLYLAISQEELRDGSDDSTAQRGPLVVDAAMDDGDLHSPDLRALAAAFLNAADELDKVTGGEQRWTEDQL